MMHGNSEYISNSYYHNQVSCKTLYCILYSGYRFFARNIYFAWKVGNT